MIAAGSELRVRILDKSGARVEEFDSLVARVIVKDGLLHLDLMPESPTGRVGGKNGSMPGDKPIGVCQRCGLTVVRREDGTRAHIGWTRPEETWHDSYTAEDQQRELEHFLAKQEEAERKALEIKERQRLARELPPDGVVHRLKSKPVVLSERAEAWWRRLLR